MTNPTIQIYATDHHTRKDGHWDIPFFRLGNQQSNFPIQTIGKTWQELSVIGSEYTGVYWLGENYEYIGNPDYIGHCHYRRFFCKPLKNLDNVPIIQPTWDKYPEWKTAIFGQTDQLMLMLSKSYDALLPMSLTFQNNIVDTLLYFNKLYSWKIPELIIHHSFARLVDNMPDDMKGAAIQSFNENTFYHCNIFTCKREIFLLYHSILKKTVEEIMEQFSKIPEKDLEGCQPRWLGYIVERMTSVFFTSMIKTRGLKVKCLPLITALT